MAKIAGKSSAGKKQPSVNGDELLNIIKSKTQTKPKKTEEVIEKEDTTETTPDNTNEEKKSVEELKELFGVGFAENEYRQMYSKFESLKNNYPLKTEMHKEALVTYVKYAFKRDKAISDDDMESADKWGKLAAKQATDAKINPSQLSAADLSDGMTCFSQVSATVERAQDIIPLLNTFIEKPQDRVDYTIWQYVNYCRHLEGKPLIQYSDLFKFLKKRYAEHKGDYKFLIDESDGKFDTNDLGD